jgi:hypothetical protein
MKKIDLGQTVHILANIGVIAGIIFLVLELHQNNELMDAQRRYNRLTIATGSATLLAENPELASAVAKFNGRTANIEELDLSPAELVQLSGYYSRVIQNQEWTFLELPEQDLPVAGWRMVARQRAWRYFWDSGNDLLDSSFVRWMNENVVTEAQ